MSEERKWEQLLERLKIEKEEALEAFRVIRQEIKDEAKIEVLRERIEQVEKRQDQSEQKQDDFDLRLEELHAMMVNATGW